MSSREPLEREPRGLRSWTGAGLALLLLLVAVAVLKSYRDLREARRTEAQLEQSIAETEERIRRLQQRRDLLVDDPATLERLAREELSMVKEGDLVLLLPEPEPEPESPPGAAEGDGR